MADQQQPQPTPDAGAGTGAPPQDAAASGGEAPKLSFKEEVGAHAKRFAGKAFGKDHEVQQGEAKLKGEPIPPGPKDS